MEYLTLLEIPSKKSAVLLDKLVKIVKENYITYLRQIQSWEKYKIFKEEFLVICMSIARVTDWILISNTLLISFLGWQNSLSCY